MTRIDIVVLGALAAAFATGPTSAQAQSFSEPAAYQAQHPDRDVLNGGALTPAGRMALERRGGAADAYAGALATPLPVEARPRPHGRVRQRPQ